MTKSTLYTGVAVTVTLVVAGIFFILGVPLNTSSLTGQAAAVGTAPADVMVQDEIVGAGPGVRAGDTITVHYTGRLQDGTVFDSSEGKTPISFTVGSGEIIPGLEQGVIGMQTGGKRLMLIPPSLAYGAQAYGPIPGNSTLVFEIEVVSIGPVAQ